MLSVVGLILFAQYWTSSAWVLLSLFPGWFLLGFCAGEESKETLENGMTDWITGIAIPLTLGLIAFGVFQTSSAWPLIFAIVALAGAAFGYRGAMEENMKAEMAISPQLTGTTDLSPLRKAWNEWWAGRNQWLTKVVQNILGLAFVLSFFLFISFSTRSTVLYPTPGGPGVRASFVSFGTPSPWFELSQNAGGTTGPGVQWRILWYSSANVVMLLGLLAYWISFQIEKAKPDFKPSRFSSPTAVFSMVGAVAVLCIILGHFPLLLPEWKQKLTGASQTSLQSAIAADDVDRVKQWLSPGTPINQRDTSGRTPLEHAIIAGRERIVAFLVLRGADPLQRDAQGKTPLMLAIENNQALVVRMLLDMETLSHDKDFQFRISRIDSDLKPDTDFSVMRFDAGLATADPDGVTPDMIAAALGHTSIFQMIAMQRLCDDFDSMGRSWISHAIENRREAFLVEVFDAVNSQIPQLPPNHNSGSRITPELLAHADASGRLPLAHARELGFIAVAERIEAFCRLTIEKCDRDLAASPDYAHYNNKTRAMCLKALGESQ
jgi:hypothetical protein